MPISYLQLSILDGLSQINMNQLLALIDCPLLVFTLIHSYHPPHWPRIYSVVLMSIYYFPRVEVAWMSYLCFCKDLFFL